MVIEASICQVIRGRRLLLKESTSGISKGKWSAPGGKIESGESPAECARREVLEETGLRVGRLTHHGSLAFLMDGGKNLHTRAEVFSTHAAVGRARPSAEGVVKWFQLEQLPFETMWEDDRFWLPLVLRGLRFNATFAYDAANRRVTGFSITS